MFKNITKKVVIGSSFLMLSSAVMAAPDFSSMTTGISFSTAETAVIAVGTALAGLYIAIAGAKGVLRMIRG